MGTVLSCCGAAPIKIEGSKNGHHYAWSKRIGYRRIRGHWRSNSSHSSVRRRPCFLHYQSSRNRIEALAREDAFQTNGATIVHADLTVEEDVNDMFANISSDKIIHDFVCNAGYLQEEQVPLVDMSLSQWNTTVDRNLTSVFLSTRGYLGQLKNASVQDPSVVLIGSMSGVWGQPGLADYSAAKSAMTNGLLPTLKDEIIRLAPQGRVNLVAPGFVRTRMIKAKLDAEEEMKKVLQTASLRKFATPEDVANAVAFLISGQLSGHITGEIVRLVGGKEGRVLFDLSEIQV
ncbi:SDR family oxidoreductase [Cognatishimia sp. WU-CL00825]|uniref:SDR family oxidoreductase n=1 Tax=Cognatishimia sp. WU-CL00825 TaxID=3127658 RepID=UPI0033656365